MCFGFGDGVVDTVVLAERFIVSGAVLRAYGSTVGRPRVVAGALAPQREIVVDGRPLGPFPDGRPDDGFGRPNAIGGTST